MKTFKLILKNVVFSLSSLLLCALALVVLLGFLAYDGGGSFYETFGSNFASYLVLAVALALYCALSFFGIEKWRIHGCAYSASLFIGFILCIPIARITFENLFSGSVCFGAVVSVIGIGVLAISTALSVFLFLKRHYRIIEQENA